MEHAKNTQQQQGQHQHIIMRMSSQELNRDWRSDEDVPIYRRKVREHIVHILWQLHDLPMEVKRLEEHLYRSAPSLEVYNDISTLYHRLQRLHVGPSSNSMSMGVKSPLVHLQTQQRPQMQAQQNLLFQHQKRQEQYPTTSSSNVVKMLQPLKPNQAQIMIAPQRAQIQVQSQSHPQHRNMENIPDNINPIFMSTISQSQSQHVVAPASGNIESSSTCVGSGNAGSQSSLFAILTQNSLSLQTIEGNPHMPKQSKSLPSSTLSSAAGNGPARSSSDRQVLRHKQQRVLIFRHVAKCPHEVGKCPVTKHCGSMKHLWKHIAECKDPKCLVPHCISSKSVLNHYKRCKDQRCPMCVPVREEIREETHRHKKQTQMYALNQRHQAATKQSQESSRDQARMSIQESSTSPSQLPSSMKRRKTDTAWPLDFSKLSIYR